MIVRESVMLGNQPLTLETGRLAKQAKGSVLLTYGGTQVLVTVCTQQPRFTGGNFFPLTCDYVEKTYAAGRIPGGFFKREARLRDEEILTCRIMDRPTRPLFADGFMLDTQLVATVISCDVENKGDVLALTGASAALHISELPWEGPIAGIRVGRVDGEFLANPTQSQTAESDMDIIVAASRDAIVMVEGGAKEISERDLADALEFAHESAQPVLELIEELRAVVGRPKLEVEPPALDAKLKARVAALVDGKLEDATRIPEKHRRYDTYSAIRDGMCDVMVEEMGQDEFNEVQQLVKDEFDHRKAAIVRARVLDHGVRIDGRDTRTVRPIHTEAGVLMRTHGSALFQRGETQAIATTTLGTSADEQKIDGLSGERWKRFLLHYNFPPFSTGEVKFLRGPGRR
ncbi:MAG: polyribonucleotide nucleotidyltransferase, partial [Deltaproteobacteria bacterium]|nr:polyribonucleotide nucleotidyltransferase [Deltaproteobacteria bacterium]MBW2533791.1 polyribonucleotide nucleotidyltransferase [Deltaproteobacteria bacterium]